MYTQCFTRIPRSVTQLAFTLRDATLRKYFVASRSYTRPRGVTQKQCATSCTCASKCHDTREEDTVVTVTLATRGSFREPGFPAAPSHWFSELRSHAIGGCGWTNGVASVFLDQNWCAVPSYDHSSTPSPATLACTRQLPVLYTSAPLLYTSAPPYATWPG